MAKIIEANDPHAAWATMSVRTLITIFIYGLAVGTATLVLYWLFKQFVFEPILCREGAALARCESKDSISSGLAIIVGSFIGLALLVRERVYRPMLAVLGIVVSVWGVFGLAMSLPVILAGIVIVITIATAYVLFSWLVQPTSLVVSIAGVAIVCVLARLALS